MKRKFTKYFLASIAFFMLMMTGCISQEKAMKFWHEYDVDEIPAIELVSNEKSPEIIYSEDPIEEEIAFLKKGYVKKATIKRSGEDVSDGYYKEMGKYYGARAVALNRKLISSEIHTRYTIRPTSNTSHSTVMGPNGQVAFATTTTHGTEGTTIVESENIYSFVINVYGKPQCPVRLGIVVSDIPGEEQQYYGTAKGVKVLGVAKNLAAWEADLLVNDVILGIDGTPVKDKYDFYSVIFQKEGQVSFDIRRGEQRITILVNLPQISKERSDSRANANPD